VTQSASGFLGTDIAPFTQSLNDPACFLTQAFHSLLRLLRQHAPVHWCQPWPERGYAAVTSRAEMRIITDKPKLLSSEIAEDIIQAYPDAFHHQNIGAISARTGWGDDAWTR
jgi:hypothetical protein